MIDNDGWSTPRRRGATPKYDWDTWTDGRYHVAVLGRDYTTSTQNMRVQLSQKATKNDMRVSTTVVRQFDRESMQEIELLVFRFLRRGDEDFNKLVGLLDLQYNRNEWVHWEHCAEPPKSVLRHAQIQSPEEFARLGFEAD